MTPNDLFSPLRTARKPSLVGPLPLSTARDKCLNEEELRSRNEKVDYPVSRARVLSIAREARESCLELRIECTGESHAVRGQDSSRPGKVP